MTTMKYYAGIGSRETPSDILSLMTNISEMLEEEGYVLRSGGADGADLAFEKGVKKNKEIFLPWKNFNNNSSSLFEISEEAEKMAEKFHPNYSYLSQGAKRLHARNCNQVLGSNLNSPVEFVICWTKYGTENGGTGQAMRIAKANGIKIYNLGKEDDLLLWKNRVEIFNNFKKWKQEIKCQTKI